jgi:hypothetical protein
MGSYTIRLGGNGHEVEFQKPFPGRPGRSVVVVPGTRNGVASTQRISSILCMEDVNAKVVPGSGEPWSAEGGGPFFTGTSQVFPETSHRMSWPVRFPPWPGIGHQRTIQTFHVSFWFKAEGHFPFPRPPPLAACGPRLPPLAGPRDLSSTQSPPGPQPSPACTAAGPLSPPGRRPLAA